MNLYLFVFDTLSDWEIGYLTAEVFSRRFFASKDADCTIMKTRNARKQITTMGGMKLMPDIAIDEIKFRENDILVLPGGDSWMSPETDRILDIAKRRIEADELVAAICGATIGLARVGALNAKKHTSNDREYLKHVAKPYTGEKNYIQSPATCDKNLITASGQSPVQFTYEIIKALGLFRSDTLEAWKNLNLTNEAQYFFEMMSSLEARNG